MKSITISLILYASLASAADLLGCYSSVNGNNQGTYKYQSSSYCQNECSDSPYFAMTNGGDCYCLTSKPSDETDSSDCNTPCFGWKSETCGGDSAYSVYVGTGSDDTGEDTSSLAAAAAASSTTSSSTSSTSTSSSTEPTSSAAAATTSSQEDNTSTSEKPSSTTDAPDSSATLVTTSSSNSEGHVIVKTVTKDADSTSLASATPTASSDSDDKDDNKKKSSNVGPIVGGVVGGVAGLAIIGFLAFFFVKRRRDQEDNDEEEFFDKPIGAMGGSINRNYGTGKSKKSVKTNALDMPMTNPFTHPSDNDPTALSDPRLNSVMMGRRRLSEGSLADETDYSRKILQVANPDD